MIAIPLVLLLVGSAWGDSNCPPEAKVAPCSCSKNINREPTISCGAGRSFDDVQGVLSRIKGNGLLIRFDGIRFDDIPTDFFDGHIFSELYFSSCQMNSIESPAFHGLENSLQVLEILESGRINLDLGNFKILRAVYISGNDIPEVGNEWFRGGPESLKHLYLNNNQIKILGDEAFASLSSLRELNLQHNNILSVQRSMLPQSSQLAGLYLSHNYISDLPDDFFSEMADLLEVNLQNNRLTTLTKEPWDLVWENLDTLNVDENPIECDQKIRWIYKKNSLPPFLEGQCHGTNSLKDKYLEELEDRHFELL